MTTSQTDVLIIGAGPTGLTMANLLIRQGVQVRIIDKKAGPNPETRAIIVHARTLELLDKLDLATEAVAQGRRMDAFHLFTNGKSVGRLSFTGESERSPYPFPLIFTQDRMEQLLLEKFATSGGQVEWNTELVSLQQTSSTVNAIIRHADQREEAIVASWLVGADGSHSPVRHALALKFAGESYKQALFLADVDIAGDRIGNEVFGGFTRLGFFTFFPMPGGRFRALGSLPLEYSNRETLTVEEVQQIINTYKGSNVRITRARWISVYRTHHRMSEHFRVGRVFLIGDAAHIHSPAGGQGMNTGIGDAYNLAWKLALVVTGKAHTRLLDSYELERMPFARAILNGSDKAFHIQGMSQPAVQWLKMMILPILLRFVTGSENLRKRAFWFLSQLWTTYRTSPAVKEAGSTKKGPRAGDRAPFGFFEAGRDTGKSMYHLLKNQDHHLFFFVGDAETTSLNLPEIEARLQELTATYAAPIQLHVVSAAHRDLQKRYAVTEPTLFLIRPDGHIAYHGRADDRASMTTFLDTFFTKKSVPVHTRQAQPLGTTPF